MRGSALEGGDGGDGPDDSYDSANHKAAQRVCRVVSEVDDPGQHDDPRHCLLHVATPPITPPPPFPGAFPSSDGSSSLPLFPSSALRAGIGCNYCFLPSFLVPEIFRRERDRRLLPGGYPNLCKAVPWWVPSPAIPCFGWVASSFIHSRCS